MHININDKKNYGISKITWIHTKHDNRIHHPCQYDIKPQFYQSDNGEKIWLLLTKAKQCQVTDQKIHQIFKKEMNGRKAYSDHIIQHRIRWTVVILKNNK